MLQRIIGTTGATEGQGEERQVREEDGTGMGSGVGKSLHGRDKLCFRSTSTHSVASRTTKMISRRRVDGARLGISFEPTPFIVRIGHAHHCQRLIHKTLIHPTARRTLVGGQFWSRPSPQTTSGDRPLRYLAQISKASATIQQQLVCRRSVGRERKAERRGAAF